MASQKVANLIGATGLVGSALLHQLLEDDTYSAVNVFGRRTINLTHPKLNQHLVHFDRILEWKDLLEGDVLFSCLGTTLRKAGSKEAQYKVDYTFQYNVAKAAADQGIAEYVLVSSAGANANSSLFYSRIKGELDRDVEALNFRQIHIIRPSILSGKRSEFRLGERIGLVIAHMFLSWMPFVRKYRPIRDETVATAMRKAVLRYTEPYTIYELEEVFALAKA